MKEEYTVLVIIALLFIGVSAFLFGFYFGKIKAPCGNYFNPDECDFVKIEEKDRYICPSKAMIKYQQCLKRAGEDNKEIDRCFWEYNKDK